jgi:hypothetical protein
MTAHEVLSLGLLAKVASGISLLLADRVLTGDNREGFPNTVATWSEQFAALEREVVAAINPASHS